MKHHHLPFWNGDSVPYGLKKPKSPKLAKMAFLPFHTFYFLLVIFTQSFWNFFKSSLLSIIHHIFSALVEGDYARAACSLIYFILTCFTQVLSLFGHVM